MRADYSRVTHPCAALLRTEVPFTLDLHVLGLPPAFVLSQDQTLQFDLFLHLLRDVSDFSTTTEVIVYLVLKYLHYLGSHLCCYRNDFDNCLLSHLRFSSCRGLVSSRRRGRLIRVVVGGVKKFFSKVKKNDLPPDLTP